MRDTRIDSHLGLFPHVLLVHEYSKSVTAAVSLRNEICGLYRRSCPLCRISQLDSFSSERNVLSFISESMWRINKGFTWEYEGLLRISIAEDAVHTFVRGGVRVVTHPVRTVRIYAPNVIWYASVLIHSTTSSVTLTLKQWNSARPSEPSTCCNTSTWLYTTHLLSFIPRLLPEKWCCLPYLFQLPHHRHLVCRTTGP